MIYIETTDEADIEMELILINDEDEFGYFSKSDNFNKIHEKEIILEDVQFLGLNDLDDDFWG